MRKLFFIISLVCVSLLSNARSISGCGYSYSFLAMAGAAQRVAEFYDPEYFVVWEMTTFTQDANGYWCYSIPLFPTGEISPAPNPKPVLNTLASGYLATRAEAIPPPSPSRWCYSVMGW